jgi:hypothetical protein
VPLWIFLLVLLPAIFGVWAALGRWRLRPSLHVIANPLYSVCFEGEIGGKPAMYVRVWGTFTNMSRIPQLLVYAYLEGTTCLFHFHEPISIPPGRAALNVDVQFQCTRPKHLPKDGSVKVVFVDAGGLKYPQRLNLKVQARRPAAAPAPVLPPVKEPAPPQ